MILTVTLNAAIDKRYVVNDFKTDEVNRVTECAYVAGGKGLNVSKTATIAGANVTATGFVNVAINNVNACLCPPDSLATLVFKRSSNPKSNSFNSSPSLS